MVVLICICLISNEVEQLLKRYFYFLFPEMPGHVKIRFLNQLYQNEAVTLIAT